VKFATHTLLYAAIFSDPTIYSCNVQRLLRRLSNITDIYLEKAKLLDTRRCDMQKIGDELAELKAKSNEASRSFNPEFSGITALAGSIESKNKRLECPVF
jgi:hypothetical protein